VGPDSGLTLADIEAARAGVSPTIGPREGYRPTLWLDDAATAVVAALRAPAGVYNVADESPPTRAEIDSALAAVVGRTSLRPAILDPGPEYEPLPRSHRVSSRRLQEATGWRPRVCAGTEGWALVAEATVAA
jgi:nucleoside-diphosphate-sugar epimerase